MSSLSKAQLSDALNMDVLLDKVDAKEVVESFFEEIKQVLEMGQHVKVSGFGNFILRDKTERPGRNPKTKESIPIAARRVVTFKPGLKLKCKIKSQEK